MIRGLLRLGLVYAGRLTIYPPVRARAAICFETTQCLGLSALSAKASIPGIQESCLLGFYYIQRYTTLYSFDRRLAGRGGVLAPWQ
jgi:hypothetical protein